MILFSSSYNSFLSAFYGSSLFTCSKFLFVSSLWASNSALNLWSSSTHLLRTPSSAPPPGFIFLILLSSSPTAFLSEATWFSRESYLLRIILKSSIEGKCNLSIKSLIFSTSFFSSSTSSLLKLTCSDRFLKSFLVFWKSWWTTKSPSLAYIS